jgi:MFS family permease
MGAGEAALFSGGLPWVLAGTPANRRGRVSGWFGLSMWAGLTLGPLLAVLVHRVGGDTAVWLVVIALPLVSTALVASTRRQSRPASAEAVGTIRPKSWRDVVPRGVGLPGLCLGLAAYGYGSLTALLVLYLTADHVGGQSVGLSVFAISFLLTRSLGSPQVDRHGGVPVARCVLGIEMAGLLLLALVRTEWAALAGAAITGIGIATIYPATIAVTLHRTGGIRPGVAMGAMTSLWDIGILVAGPIGGLVATHAGYQVAFAVAAGMAIIALIVTFILPAQPTSMVSSTVRSGDRIRS